MCIVALAWQLLPDLPLCLISNRDEFYARKSLSLHEWQSGIFAGQDEQAHGTWMGVTRAGRWAVLTNHRNGLDKTTYATSRGHLVAQYLQSDVSPMAFGRSLSPSFKQFAGFNLIIGDRQQAVYISNRGDGIEPLAHGVHVVSNNLKSEHWHKCTHLRQRFVQELLPIAQSTQYEKLNDLSDALSPIAWQLLEDDRQLPNDKLPNTGIDDTWEKMLSSTFIASNHYGTRVSNLLLMSQNSLHWQEKSQHGDDCGQITQVQFSLD